MGPGPPHGRGAEARYGSEAPGTPGPSMPLPGAAPRRAQSSAGREAAAPPFLRSRPGRVTAVLTPFPRGGRRVEAAPRHGGGRGHRGCRSGRRSGRGAAARDRRCRSAPAVGAAGRQAVHLVSARPAASTWSRTRIRGNGLDSAAGLRCARADGLGALGGEVRAGTGTEGFRLPRVRSYGGRPASQWCAGLRGCGCQLTYPLMHRDLFIYF